MTNYLIYSKKEDPGCPHCRGASRVIANYRFVGANHFKVDGESPVTARSEASREPSQERASASEGPRPSGMPSGAYPWWPLINQMQDASDASTCYHANTRLSDGRLGLLIDPGAWANLAGENWTKELARKALEAGHRPSQRKLAKPYEVKGVGTGQNAAAWEVTLPIALIEENEGETSIHQYQAPAVGGQGRELPALLGLQTMSRMKAVLEMTEGEEYLTFPGPGGYTIDWAPGSRRYKLEKAPSGHLILPCDNFFQAKKETGGVATPRINLLAEQHQPPAVQPQSTPEPQVMQTPTVLMSEDPTFCSECLERTAQCICSDKEDCLFASRNTKRRTLDSPPVEMEE